MRKNIDFQTFWDAYGLKRDRIAAERAWKRLPTKDQRAAYAGIPAYREDCQRRGIAMMYAQGYLNHRRWEDIPLPNHPANVPLGSESSKFKVQSSKFKAQSPETSLDNMEIWK